VYWVCSWQKKSLRDSRGELLSINANNVTRGCEVFDQNQKVQKATKHDFGTYWSVLGTFVAKNHFAIRA
jgi:phosphatidylserine decarboxylase